MGWTEESWWKLFSVLMIVMGVAFLHSDALCSLASFTYAGIFWWQAKRKKQRHQVPSPEEGPQALSVEDEQAPEGTGGSGGEA